MKKSQLNSSLSTLQKIQTIGIWVSAAGILFLVFSLLGYQPSDRLDILATATQQSASGILATVTPKSQVKDGEPLQSDYACSLLNVTMNGQFYKEYTIGYFIVGEVLTKTGETNGVFTEVTTEGTRLSKYTETCWIKE